MKDVITKKYGMVVILGRPNTGKSTLLNAIMQQKVAITSPLPQTTRKNILAVFEDERGKILFTDTPGVLGKVSDLMGKKVNQEAPKTLNKAQLVICVVDISRPKSEEENKVIGLIRKVDVKKILIYNKIDKAIGSKDHLADYNYLEEEFDKTLSISALKEKNVKGVINAVFEMLPEKNNKEIEAEIGARQEENKPVIGMGSKEYVEEIIREKAYLFLREEVPYTIFVGVDKIDDKKKLIVISATIYTNADRYKKMIIGREGQKIKEIGYNARKELELMSGRKIFLELTVKTDKHWMERVNELG
ncbi:MAG: GTPase Era [Candidatus Shapirobacteria bacterium GW2011_GWE1_38_10]|uniref:GTPase Era n=1 Tax=Candidatus Shapirobacteria bacterium GW2011_GWE1_38_10 TaxID=1618488 RepID=A0A0G0I584_9BACT|nr:MAG: GTPase Era [Candidatus Shapirobacteria bacterium GW2011_GWF2_37_20]KKQ49702.1 MAG: GTPase Era [Candidatus Shapirobacteria bacterium GW2011_GWE1_38_10]HBP50775.1 GTPase Era [Candidatus Shapirobacteria bacterium]